MRVVYLASIGALAGGAIARVFDVWAIGSIAGAVVAAVIGLFTLRY